MSDFNADHSGEKFRADHDSGGDKVALHEGHLSAGYRSDAVPERHVGWAWETRDGTGGTIVINGQSFDLAEGRLFLVETKGEQPRIMQLERDFDFEGDSEVVSDLAVKDPDIREFVDRALESIVEE